MNTSLLMFLLLTGTTTVNATQTPVTIFWYDEKETGTDPTHMRYLVSDQFIRIDEGRAEDNYILFDAEKNKIYSVNHNDQTLMVIKHQPWERPEFEFKHQVIEKALHDAPKIGGKTVHNYQVTGDGETCTDVHFITGMFPKRMVLMQQYQQVLASQLVRSLSNTPKEMHTPCFLADQVYNSGEYYAKGLPVQIWHSRGYARLLVNYKNDEVDGRLFALPKDYREYHPHGE